MLGDGRAILLGEQITPHGERRDIQLKGGGRTPFSGRRRACRPRPDAAGIPDQRGHACPGHPHHPRPGGGGQRRAGAPRYRRARRRAHPGGGLPPARGHLPVRRRPPRPGSAPRAVRLHPGTPLPGPEGRGQPGPGPAGRGHGAAHRSGGGLDAGGFYPRRAQHRQRDPVRRDHRLRPLRLHGCLSPGHGVQLHRPARPLRLRQPAGDHPVEPGPAGGNPGAADRRRQRGRRGARRGPAGRIRRPLRATLAGDDGRQAGPARRAGGGRPRPGGRPARLDAPGAGGLHQYLPWPDRPGGARWRGLLSGCLPGLAPPLAGPAGA